MARLPNRERSSSIAWLIAWSRLVSASPSGSAEKSESCAGASASTKADSATPMSLAGLGRALAEH